MSTTHSNTQKTLVKGFCTYDTLHNQYLHFEYNGVAYTAKAERDNSFWSAKFSQVQSLPVEKEYIGMYNIAEFKG